MTAPIYSHLIAQEDEEAQEILSFGVFDAGLGAALGEIAQGEAISPLGLSLTGELNVLEKIRFGCAQTQTGIHAPSLTKNEKKERDPAMHQANKGNHWYFGMKGQMALIRRKGWCILFVL